MVPLERDSGAALHRQIESSINDAVGRPAAAGTPLPATRGLAASLRVSRGVVVEAYEQLVAEGYLRADSRRLHPGRRSRRVDPPRRRGAHLDRRRHRLRVGAQRPRELSARRLAEIVAPGPQRDAAPPPLVPRWNRRPRVPDRDGVVPQPDPRPRGARGLRSRVLWFRAGRQSGPDSAQAPWCANAGNRGSESGRRRPGGGRVVRHEGRRHPSRRRGVGRRRARAQRGRCRRADPVAPVAGRRGDGRRHPHARDPMGARARRNPRRGRLRRRVPLRPTGHRGAPGPRSGARRLHRDRQQDPHAGPSARLDGGSAATRSAAGTGQAGGRPRLSGDRSARLRRLRRPRRVRPASSPHPPGIPTTP